jgi:uncharacterized protein (TIGR02001 family)
MQKLWKSLALSGAMAAAVVASPASAQILKSGDLTVTGNIAGTTDYVFRGFSQTRERPTLQGNLDASYKWLYVGMFLSGIDFADDLNGTLVRRKQGTNIGNVEIDVYGGVKIPVGSMLEMDVGVIGYLYPDALDGTGRALAELDYVEIKAGGTFKPTDSLAFTLFGYYSPEYTNKTGEVFTLEGGAAYTLPTFAKIGTTLSALIGYQTGDDLRYSVNVANGKDNYLYWNVGSTFTFAERFSIDLRYWDTNVKDNALGTNFCTGFVFQCDARFVATAKVTF